MTQAEREILYTLRWHLRERWQSEETQEKALDILGQLLEPDAQADVRPSATDAAQKMLWCPFAQTNFEKAKTKGNYRRGYPEGAIVHFTAGRHRSLADEMSHQIKNNFTYFVIDAEGNIAQNFPLDSWGNHAGISRWQGLGDSVSSKLVGIEVQNGGKLKRVGNAWKTWFDLTIPPGDTRTIAKDTENQQQAGTYQKYTAAQEEALFRLLRWLKSNNPEVFSNDLVLGHDEVSGPQGIGYWRKNDPGGALSMTMQAL
jgi:hypothetical protein